MFLHAFNRLFWLFVRLSPFCAQYLFQNRLIPSIIARAYIFDIWHCSFLVSVALNFLFYFVFVPALADHCWCYRFACFFLWVFALFHKNQFILHIGLYFTWEIFIRRSSSSLFPSPFQYLFPSLVPSFCPRKHDLTIDPWTCIRAIQIPHLPWFFLVYMLPPTRSVTPHSLEFRDAVVCLPQSHRLINAYICEWITLAVYVSLVLCCLTLDT